MRILILLLALVSSPMFGQVSAPRFMYIYRDSLKRGVDSAYRVIEDDGAQICADLRCPNPYLGIESLSGPHEAWWINMFGTEADTGRVANVYATDRALSTALSTVAQRKAALIGTPIQGFAVYRGDLSRGPAWSVAGARFIVVSISRDHRPVNGSVWAMADSTLYVLRAVRTRREADALARQATARVFAVRPNWSMPAPEWVTADAAFWRSAPHTSVHMSSFFLWLPLLAIAAHLTEEFLWPGGFSRWYRAYPPGTTAVVSTRFLIAVNAVFVALAVVPLLLGVSARAFGYWLVVAAIAGANGLFHVRATLRTRSYSPGVVTGVALYIPLAVAGGTYLLRTGLVSPGTAIQAVAISAAYAWWSAWQHRRHASVRVAANDR